MKFSLLNFLTQGFASFLIYTDIRPDSGETVMKNKLSLKYLGLSTLSLTSFYLAGCSGYSPGLSNRQIKIDSQPQPATVLVDGSVIGSTPLTIVPSDVFQSGFTAGDRAEDGIVVYRYMGRLEVKKVGCKTFSTQVDDNLLSSNIHVKLDCDSTQDKTRIETESPTRAPQFTEDRDNPGINNAEQRLLRLEALHNKGLIRDDEYRDLRKRILDTL